MKFIAIIAAALSFFIVGCPESKSPHIGPANTLELKYETGQDLMDLGEYFLKHGNYGMAVLYYRQAARHEDSVCSSLYRIDEICRVATLYGKYPSCGYTSAEKKADKDCIPSRSWSQISFRFARKLSREGRHLDSKGALRESIKADPGWGPPYCLLARKIENHEEENDPSVLEACKTCLRLASGKHTEWCNRTLEMASIDGKEVLKSCEKIIKEKKYREAVKCFKNATLFEEVSGTARMRLGDIYYSEACRDIDRAQEHYEKSMQPLIESRKKELAEEVSQKLAMIYKERKKRGDYKHFPPLYGQFGRKYGPPYCLLGPKIDRDDPEGWDYALNLCNKCIDLTSGAETEACRKVVDEYLRSE